jgi:rubrerythrin
MAKLVLDIFSKEKLHLCPVCDNLTSYKGEFGDDEESPCPLCEADEQAQACWERDREN